MPRTKSTFFYLLVSAFDRYTIAILNGVWSCGENSWEKPEYNTHTHTHSQGDKHNQAPKVFIESVHK